MKKLIIVILILALILPAVAMADFDLASMMDLSSISDEQLQNIISNCSAELMARHTTEPEGTLIFEYEGVKVYQTGKAEVNAFTGFLTVPVAVYNDTDSEMVISAENTHCNGWDISAGNCRASAKSKKKDDIYFDITDADVKTIDQIDSLNFKWQVYDYDHYSTIYTQEKSEEHRFW